MRQSVTAIITAEEPIIDKIRELAGSPGLSVGVLHHGETVYTGHFGQIDTTSGRKPNDETVHFIASMSKAMVSALVGIFVEEGLLSFTTKASSVIPELERALDNTGSKLMIADLLCHRTGISRSDAFWLQGGGHEMMLKSDALATFVVQPAVREFRAEFMYSNFCYGIVDMILEKLTGKTMEENLQEKLFKPLGMTRTTMEPWTDDNFARTHFPLRDGTHFETPLPSISNKTINGASAGVRTCVRDLLKYYQNYMVAVNDQFKNETTSTPGSPFKQLLTLLKPHNQLECVSIREQSYALGWARAQLPCTLGRINNNKSLVANLPVVGEGAPSRLVLYHGGSLQGIASAVYLLPESNTAIVAMQNSNGFFDGSDWASQHLIETIFGAENPVNFEALATEASMSGRGLADDIERELQKGRQKGTKARDLQSYVGTYDNPSNTFHIKVQFENGKLSISLQSMSSETYELRHYHHDEFVWNEDYDATAKRGRFQTRPAISYKIKFTSQSGEDGAPINCLEWSYDAYLREPVQFKKRGSP